MKFAPKNDAGLSQPTAFVWISERRAVGTRGIRTPACDPSKCPLAGLVRLKYNTRAFFRSSEIFLGSEDNDSVYRDNEYNLLKLLGAYRRRVHTFRVSRLSIFLLCKRYIWFLWRLQILEQSFGLAAEMRRLLCDGGPYF